MIFEKQIFITKKLVLVILIALYSCAVPWVIIYPSKPVKAIKIENPDITIEGINKKFIIDNNERPIPFYSTQPDEGYCEGHNMRWIMLFPFMFLFTLGTYPISSTLQTIECIQENFPIEYSKPRSERFYKGLGNNNDKEYLAKVGEKVKIKLKGNNKEFNGILIIQHAVDEKGLYYSNPENITYKIDFKNVNFQEINDDVYYVLGGEQQWFLIIYN